MDNDDHHTSEPPAPPAPSEADLIEQSPRPRLGLSVSTIVAIFLGGALGTVARFLLDEGHPSAAGHFPLTTLLVNLSGSLVIGAAVPWAERVRDRLPALRAFAVIGVLGGWTTYSTLANDSIQLVQHGHVLTALGYLAATVLGGLAAVLIGHRLATGAHDTEATS